jgi:hypothetical protein
MWRVCIVVWLTVRLWIDERVTVLHKLDLTRALDEILYHGMRAWAKGISFRFRGRAYAIYIVRYKPTLPENKDGRWN